jgi:V/A-type H+-transporting ATPase subunit E
MEVQLQELVDKIRKDGVESADAKAREIIQKAETQAASIIDNAKKEALTIVKNAVEEAARSEKAAVSAISQAGRNVILSFRDGIGHELDALVKSETAKAYDASVLKELLPVAVKSWIANNKTDDISVLLSPADSAKLESAMKSALKDEIAKGLVIGTDVSLAGGFKIGSKDGSAYYDFSADAVAELFSAYLNPRVAGILKAASKES